MNFVYGPIPSRRLGRSLGVDPIPLKTCNWNCVYCQLGRTSPLENERREWAPREAIVAEVLEAVAAHPPGSIDHITFVGSGEPTLHSGLGWMIREVKRHTTLPVAVITNGALMSDAGVCDDLLAADIVMPTISAGSEELFRRIHRPHPDVTLEAMLAGLERFRPRFGGRIWVEVMLIAGVNDGEAALTELATAIARVRPDELHLVLPDRPPTEPWVTPPDDEGLMRAVALLGRGAAVVPPSGAGFDLSGHATLEEAVLAILQRHPMSEAQVAAALAESVTGSILEHAAATMEQLAANPHVRVVTRHGVRFWTTDAQLFDANGAAAAEMTRHASPTDRT
jgi:wyosine [tRNA(Phe)-imidazoG37] synthetase (radical SAM superfamily)